RRRHTRFDCDWSSDVCSSDLVTGLDSAALEGVNVTVTSISGNVNRTAKTDSRGRFTVTFPGGDGDYMVQFASLGYAAKRFEVKRSEERRVGKECRTGWRLDL